MAHARTPTPNSMMLLDGGSFIEDSSPRTSSGKRRILRKESNSSLEILPPEDEESQSSRNRRDYDVTIPRPGTSDSQRVDSATRRTPTPTKQVALQAVRRKEERDYIEAGQLGLGFTPIGRSPKKEVSKKTHQKHKCHAWDSDSKGKENHKSSHQNCASKSANQSHLAREPTTQIAYDSKPKAMCKSSAKVVTRKPAEENSDEFDTDLEDGGDTDNSAEEEEPPTAPTELMMEFLECMMLQDYENAKKLCTMILLYEPDNAEAKNFQPLIEEKLALDAEDEEGSDEGSSEGDSDDDSDDDSDVESGDSSDDDDDEYETEEEEEHIGEDSSKPDSGISSATELFENM